MWKIKSDPYKHNKSIFQHKCQNKGLKHMFLLEITVFYTKNAQISAERWGTAMEVEVAIVVHGVFPLPLVIERVDRCE